MHIRKRSRQERSTWGTARLHAVRLGAAVFDHIRLPRRWARRSSRAVTVPTVREAGAQSNIAAHEAKRLLDARTADEATEMARRLVARLATLSDDEMVTLLNILGGEFLPDFARVHGAADAFRRDPGPMTLQTLAETVESPRQELFRRINAATGGTRMLLNMRRTLLERSRSAEPHEAQLLQGIDFDLTHLFASWFSPAFLDLRRITWDAPAHVLERVIQNESVHTMSGWKDLKLRLADDRRCFAFFHPSLPSDPLIFVEVALTRGMPSSIAPLISTTRRTIPIQEADTATFYSINSCEPGLRQIALGGRLIKRVCGVLRADMPGVSRFATLSPLPGLRASLMDPGTDGFTLTRLRCLLKPLASSLRRTEGDLREYFIQAVEAGTSTIDARALKRIAVAYLFRYRRTSRIADPVAHFHLTNGARVERINVNADPSPGGRSSLGLMVNYLYDPRKVRENEENYVYRGIVRASGPIDEDIDTISPCWL